MLNCGSRILWCVALLSGCAAAPLEPLAPHLASPVPHDPARDELVFTSMRDNLSQLYTIRGDGTGERRLGSREHAELQPAVNHEGQVVYVSYRSGGGDLYLSDLKGTAARQLTSSPTLDQNPVWSPNGRQIAFSSDREAQGSQVFVINSDGQAESAVSGTYREVAGPVWSPDGTRLAFVARINHSARIVIADLGQQHTHLLTPNLVFENPFKEGEYQPVWSPDGESIVYVHSGDRKLGINLRIAPAAGGEPTLLTTGTNLNSGASFSPDGSRILFLTNSGSEGGIMNVHVMRRDGTDKRNLTRSATADLAAEWSADGNHIYFMSFRDWPGQLYRMAADGTEVSRLTRSNAQDGFPVVRPIRPVALMANN